MADIKIAKFKVVPPIDKLPENPTEADKARRGEQQKAWREQRDRWLRLATEVQRIQNFVRGQWYVEHVLAGSQDKAYDFIVTRTNFRRAESALAAKAKAESWTDKKLAQEQKKLGKAPQCGVSFKPTDDFEKRMQSHVAEHFPHVYSYLRNIIIRQALGDLDKNSTKYPSFKRWLVTLANLGESVSNSAPQPVPFMKQNCVGHTDGIYVIPPQCEDDNWSLELMLNLDGRSSVRDRIQLLTKRKGCYSEVQKLKKIASGEFEFCGSKLVFKRNEVFVHIGYKHVPSGKYVGVTENGSIVLPQALGPRDVVYADFEPLRPEAYQYKRGKLTLVEPANNKSAKRPQKITEKTIHIRYRYELDPAETAMLTAPESHPFLLHTRDRDFWIGGNGKNVEYVRHHLLVNRWGRQESYRYAGSNRKSHGRKRAIAGQQKYELSWRDFTKSFNCQSASRIVKILLEMGIGTLEYTKGSDRSFLAKAGKVEGRQDSTGWDWYQFESILKRKCDEVGIAVVVHEPSEEMETVGAA